MKFYVPALDGERWVESFTAKKFRPEERNLDVSAFGNLPLPMSFPDPPKEEGVMEFSVRWSEKNTQIMRKLDLVSLVGVPSAEGTLPVGMTFFLAVPENREV